MKRARTTTSAHEARILAVILAGVGGTVGGATEGEPSGAFDVGQSSDSPRPNGCGSQKMTQQASGRICATRDDAGDGGDAGDGSDDASPTDGGDATDAGECFATCEEACNRAFPGGDERSCEVKVVDGHDQISCHYTQSYGCGRACEGLEMAGAGGPTLGATYATAAWMEAASIVSFRRLARELRAHGAPEELVAAARDAARDEVRHAREMAKLAREHGAAIPRVHHAPFRMRSLEAIALENAKEGCVFETYSAGVAAWQASHADDADVRATLATIARDEVRHAALAYAIAEWVDGVLDDAARERVRAARRLAVEELRALVDMPIAAELVRAGYPSRDDAGALATAVARLAA